jgi:hypothetical protein
MSDCFFTAPPKALPEFVLNLVVIKFRERRLQTILHNKHQTLADVGKPDSSRASDYQLKKK